MCLTSLKYAWPWKQLLCDGLIHVSPRQGLAFYFHVISEIRCNQLWWYIVSKTMAWAHWNHLNTDFNFLCMWFLINGKRIFILSLGFKFQNIAFPIPTLPFFLFTFPKHKPAAAGPGSWLSASTQQAVWYVCFLLLHHVESFSLAISFYNVVLVGKSPWCQAQERGSSQGGMCVSETALCAPLGEGTTMCLLTMVSSCSQLST